VEPEVLDPEDQLGVDQWVMTFNSVDKTWCSSSNREENRDREEESH
jgi:hypothetical protein